MASSSTTARLDPGFASAFAALCLGAVAMGISPIFVRFASADMAGLGALAAESLNLEVVADGCPDPAVEFLAKLHQFTGQAAGRRDLVAGSNMRGGRVLRGPRCLSGPVCPAWPRVALVAAQALAERLETAAEPFQRSIWVLPAAGFRCVEIGAPAHSTVHLPVRIAAPAAARWSKPRSPLKILNISPGSHERTIDRTIPRTW